MRRITLAGNGLLVHHVPRSVILILPQHNTSSLDLYNAVHYHDGRFS